MLITHATSAAPPWLLLYSAADHAGLADAARADAKSLGEGNDPAAAGHRAPGRCRLAVAAGDRDGLVEGLTFFADGLASPRWVAGQADSAAARVAWCFGGHGSQWPGMGRALLDWSPEAADVLNELDDLLPGGVLGPLTGQMEASQDTPAATQPLIFAIQVATARWLWASGLRPAAVIGHSLGEVAAAHVSGALSLTEAARVVSTRSRLLNSVGDGGAMATVGLDRETTADRCAAAVGGTVVVAAHSAPQETVITGDEQATAALIENLQSEGVRCRMIRITAASHGPRVDSVLPELRAELADLAPALTHTAWLSTVNPGSPPLADADYWARNLRQPVRFTEAVSTLAGRGIRAFLEIGPHPVLLKPLRDTLHADGVDEPLLTASGHRGTPESVSLLRALGALYCRGANVPVPTYQGLTWT
ncbi:acyltransferase domain-containing protein [Rhodococcus sp. ABRD24]|uniref:acyltransferase domain-containing protein n=1 Tax=Rhodococcus sp. ABRD24 TaxID=2507582 RepID=UPI0010389BB1|nr:acyltransferase domain-containing protein [Rhodococcus sp. ABRD24]QBJ98208.1 acyltransferase domain-containing protein [Rhodococcus sp. ABRD24]